MSGNKVQDKPIKVTENGNVGIKTEQQLIQEFVDKYQKLCDEYKLQIVVNPAFKARDDSTWSVVLQTSVGKIKSE